MSWKIPLFKIYWGKDDMIAVNRIIRSGMYWAEGLAIEEFEQGLARYIGVKHCVVFNSGTSALHAALIAHGIKKDDEVIVPSFTFIATANAALFVGARPVFADIEERTYGLDPDDVERKVTAKTKAIIAVHYGGLPCRIKELKEIAKKRSLVLIEDAAESFGAKIRNKKIGSFGNDTVLSFCQNKVITTGEGGALLTNSKEIFEKARLLRSHGRQEITNYFSSRETADYLSLGYNFRMSSLTAALGIAQLVKTGKIIKLRRKNAAYLTHRISDEIQELETLREPKGYFNVFQLYTVRIKKHRDALSKYLASRGIMSKVYFAPVHLTRFYKSLLRHKQTLPVTERIAKQVLSLPMYPTLKIEEMDYLIKEIKNFFRREK